MIETDPLRALRPYLVVSAHCTGGQSWLLENEC